MSTRVRAHVGVKSERVGQNALKPVSYTLPRDLPGLFLLGVPLGVPPGVPLGLLESREEAEAEVAESVSESYSRRTAKPFADCLAAAAGVVGAKTSSSSPSSPSSSCLQFSSAAAEAIARGSI